MKINIIKTGFQKDHLLKGVNYVDKQKNSNQETTNKSKHVLNKKKA